METSREMSKSDRPPTGAHTRPADTGKPHLKISYDKHLRKYVNPTIFRYSYYNDTRANEEQRNVVSAQVLLFQCITVINSISNPSGEPQNQTRNPQSKHVRVTRTP
ncbi:unnamed protein product [Ectocarpus sp. 4 AP-2014]